MKPSNIAFCWHLGDLFVQTFVKNRYIRLAYALSGVLGNRLLAPRYEAESNRERANNYKQEYPHGFACRCVDCTNRLVRRRLQRRTD